MEYNGDNKPMGIELVPLLVYLGSIGATPLSRGSALTTTIRGYA